MSSPDAPRKSALLACAALLVLAGCSVSPLHGTADTRGGTLNLTYAEPNNRLEQVVYQNIGAFSAAGGPLLSARVAVSNADIGRADVASPVTERQSTATITYTVSQGEQILASGTRRATAPYQTTGQILADDSARDAAQEQATRAAAEQVRLALIAALAVQ